MPKEEPMIRVQDVKFRYDPEQPTYAVDGVSLNVRRGEFVAVLGANGCGKSTLAKHFNAILLPETGTVLVENMDTRGEDHLYDIRQKVGMVFQNPDNQIVATIVEEDVAFAPENLGVPAEEIRTRIDEAMKLAGIYEKREAAPYKLSGGQKQRVAIAGVIAMRPDCLVLDEATAMLDPHGRSQVMRTIHQLREAGIRVTIQPVEWSTWLDTIYNGRQFQATVVGVDAANMTARAMLERFTSDYAKNFINYSNPAYDALFQQAINATDEAAQTDLYKQMETMLADTAANVYIQDLSDLVAMRQDLGGLKFYPIYVLDLSTVYLTQQ